MPNGCTEEETLTSAMVNYIACMYCIHSYGTVFLSIVPRNIRKFLQKNRFPNSFQISQLPLQAGLL